MSELQSLFIRGLHGKFPGTDRELLTELAQGIVSSKYKVFVVQNAAFCIISMPDSKFAYPQIVHFYSEKPLLRRSLVAKVLDFIKNKGYNKLIAINGSGTTDKIWSRAFRREGWEIKAVNTVFEFEVA